MRIMLQTVALVGAFGMFGTDAAFAIKGKPTIVEPVQVSMDIVSFNMGLASSREKKALCERIVTQVKASPGLARNYACAASSRPDVSGLVQGCIAQAAATMSPANAATASAGAKACLPPPPVASGGAGDVLTNGGDAPGTSISFGNFGGASGGGSGGGTSQTRVIVVP